MKYSSTRGRSPSVDFSTALSAGLAPDGGLYVPESFPRADLSKLSMQMSLPQFGAAVAGPFLAGDYLEDQITGICKAALDFPIPLRMRGTKPAVLELFHGPTAAFKDVGARFLAECVVRLPSARQRTVIVATSGDTGGAVAGAFHGKPGIEVVVLYPKGKISSRQEKQIACWGGNVRAVSVRGNFDDCQRLVKETLRDESLRSQKLFVSANSINIGRLLAQVIYYVRASFEYEKSTGRAAGFIVPTGNLGNAFAALWAKRIGFPIRKVVLATNANKSIANYFASGKWQAEPTVATLANAMDVGDPSNMERLRWLYPDPQAMKNDVAAQSVSDDEIRAAIKAAAIDDEIWCPHTATAARACEAMGSPASSEDWILVATAHPAKFETIVEPLVGREVEIPPQLAALLDRTPKADEIEPTAQALRALL